MKYKTMLPMMPAVPMIANPLVGLEMNSKPNPI